MTTTTIHTSRKLEKLVKKLIRTNDSINPGILGKWNATVFYVNRKKCWLLTNGLTKYNLILPNINTTDLKDIESLFKKAFYKQLLFDGIKVSLDMIDEIIGSLVFLPTDNDRSTTAFQTQRLFELELWIEKYGDLENLPIQDLLHRMNTGPIHIGTGRKISDFTYSVEELKKLLDR